MNTPRPFEKVLRDVLVSSSSLNVLGLFCSLDMISMPLGTMLVNCLKVVDGKWLSNHVEKR